MASLAMLRKRYDVQHMLDVHREFAAAMSWWCGDDAATAKTRERYFINIGKNVLRKKYGLPIKPSR